MKAVVDALKSHVSEPRNDGCLHFSSDLCNPRHTAISVKHPRPHVPKAWGNTLPLLQGTAVHEEIHRILAGGEDWIYESEIAVEYEYADLQHRWVGTADAYLTTPYDDSGDRDTWLLDYKTISGASLSFLDGVKEEHLYQVSAYYNFGTQPIDYVGVLYLPTSPDYRRHWSEPVFHEVRPLSKEGVIRRMLYVEEEIDKYVTRDIVPDSLPGEYKWKNNKKERCWELSYYPHYTSQYCPWSTLGDDDPCGCSNQKVKYVGCWYYYNGIEGDEEVVSELLDSCPGWLEMTA